MSKTRIYRWYISQRKDYFILHGVVTGHNKLVDSCTIRTSPIQSARISEDGLEVIINTVNTEYRCEIKNCNREKLQAYIDKADIKPDWINMVMEAVNGYKPCESDGVQLEDNSILMILGNNAPYYFHSAYMTLGGKLEFINDPSVHLGMIQDSVLCMMNIDKTYIDLRYFPYRQSTLEFYGNDTAELDFYIENQGDTSLKVGYSGKYYTIAVGERKHIVPENADNEVKEINNTDLYSVWINDSGDLMDEFKGEQAE